MTYSWRGGVDWMERSNEQKEMAARIKASLERKGMTQSQLAIKLGLSPSILNRRIKGHTPWTKTELFVMWTILGEEE